MSEEISKIFGIDLGTTYSCIAYVDEHGKPVVVPNSDNERVTPSVVHFDGDTIVVGETAKDSSALYPDEVVAFVKRSMGDSNFEFHHEDKVLKPEEISSYILRKLAQDAEQALDVEIKDVVITCPAYFGINEREATRRAGEITGLNVRSIINEPTAAAIAYGFAEQGEEKVVLVYDLGGGTFDVTMIDIKTDAISVICTGGDHNLGGKDWDDAIVRHLVSEIEDETGATEEDIMEDAETRQQLILAAEKAKKTLTPREKAPILITHGGERIKTELTREKFEELTDPLLERTISLTRDMLEEAKTKGYETFDELLLVGGSTRMPYVATRLKAELGVEPKVFDPDESVAKGASLFGWKLSINDELVKRIAEKTGKTVEEVQETPKEEEQAEAVQEAIREVADHTGFSLAAVKSSQTEIQNVCSKSFGVVALDENDVELVCNLVVKNNTVPAEVTQTFGTHEANQKSVEIRIMEDEVKDPTLDPSMAVEIGVGTLELPENLPARSPINITFKLNEEGRLEMTAVEETEGRTCHATIETKSVISGEAFEEAKARSQSLVVS